MTVEITLSDDKYKIVSEYAASLNLSVAEIFLNTLREKIEAETILDEDLTRISAEIMAERAEVYEALAK